MKNYIEYERKSTKFCPKICEFKNPGEIDFKSWDSPGVGRISLNPELSRPIREALVTVANFSPEHPGTAKDQRGYPLCLKSEIFIFIMKSFNT
jgi:hypothetical protein